MSTYSETLSTARGYGLEECVLPQPSQPAEVLEDVVAGHVEAVCVPERPVIDLVGFLDGLSEVALGVVH